MEEAKYCLHVKKIIGSSKQILLQEEIFVNVWEMGLHTSFRGKAIFEVDE